MTEYAAPPGPIVPRSARSLRSLTVIMAVMCYFACLAIGALILINRAVDAWTSGLSQEMTVQVREVQGADIEQELAKAVALLSATPGITGVEPLDRDAGARLLEPWLGTGNLQDLPIPRLIRVTIDESHPPDADQLSAALAAQVKGAVLDNHRRWQAELTRTAHALSLLSYAVLVLICVAAVAMVTFATRTVLESNRPVVDVLHLVGATDGYIATQIERRFFATGMWAGLIGVLLGLLTFFLLGITGAAGGGVAEASRTLLIATPRVALASYAALLLVPIVATFISLITARLTLIRMLRNVL